MTSAYESVAQTRPRIRRDTLFTKTPDGVLFHNANGGFRVNAKTAYQYASLLVPHFNGENLVAEICQPLGEQQREMVGELVKALYDRGFARDVPPGADTAELPAEVVGHFAEQIAYIDHYIDLPASRFQRFREARVAVLGSGPVADWCVTSLIRNGCAQVARTPGAGPAENRSDELWAAASELNDSGCPFEITSLDAAGDLVDWDELRAYEIVVVAAGTRAGAQTLRLLAAGVPEGKVLVPAWTVGPRAIVGPLSSAGSPGCWVCAALRLGANAEGEAAAELWRRVCLPDAGPASGEPTGAAAAMLGNLLGYEVFRLTTGALPAETRGKVVIQNLDSFDVVAETLLPHPGCPHCARQDSAREPLAQLRNLTADQLRAPVPEPVTEATTPGSIVDANADALVAELNDRMLLFGRHAGVFNGYTDETWAQLPLMVSTVRLSLASAGHREIAAFDVHNVAGARRRALHAAAGVYAEHVRGGLPAVPAPDLPRVDPALLGIASGTGGGHASRAGGAGDTSRAGGSLDDPYVWTRAVSLLTGDTRLVPVAAVHPFGPENAEAFFTPTRAGTGAGASLVEALREGLLSALCYPALLGAMRSAAGVARIALDSFEGSSELTFLTKAAHNMGVEAELLELPTGGAAHVLLARVEDPQAGPVWRVAAHPSWTVAAVTALRDLLGWVQLGRQVTADRAVDDGDPLLADFDAGTLVVGGESQARLQAPASLGDVLDALREGGHDVLATPTTPADLRAGGLTTVRVLLTTPAGR